VLGHGEEGRPKEHWPVSCILFEVCPSEYLYARDLPVIRTPGHRSRLEFRNFCTSRPMTPTREMSGHSVCAVVIPHPAPPQYNE
jgi:hypothetical protein